MMKHLDACLVVLATLHSAAAAVPSADQLLDRFAVNADLYQRSFVTHVETNRVIVSQDRTLGQDKPQERREQTRVVFWWDGQRMREQRYTWGDFATGTIDRDHARYESHLFEVDRSISYFRSGGRIPGGKRHVLRRFHPQGLRFRQGHKRRRELELGLFCRWCRQPRRSH